MHGDLPEIVVPTVNMPLSALAAHFRTFFGWSPRTAITGEVTLAGQRASLFLRLNGREIFKSPASVPGIPSTPCGGMGRWRCFRHTSPYRAALALYDDEPEQSISLVESIVEHYPEKNENAAWARLIRGVHHMDHLQPEKAEADLRAVRRLALSSEWLRWIPSWLGFPRPASYAQPARFHLGSSLLQQHALEPARAEFQRAAEWTERLRSAPLPRHCIAKARKRDRSGRNLQGNERPFPTIHCRRSRREGTRTPLHELRQCLAAVEGVEEGGGCALPVPAGGRGRCPACSHACGALRSLAAGASS